jgi:hypothetical protein
VNQSPIKVVLSAFGWMALGAALMALLGKWAVSLEIPVKQLLTINLLTRLQ